MVTQTDRGRGLTGQLGMKAPVVAATTTAITLVGTQTIDGVALAVEDRVLVKNQTDTTTNGVYICQLTAWLRAPDFDGDRDLLQGTQVPVALGTVNTNYIYRVTTVNPITIGTSTITFTAATTSGDLAATAADAVSTAADAVSTAADAVSTAADAVSTAVDAVSTAADVVLTAADVVTAEDSNLEAGDWANQVEDSLTRTFSSGAPTNRAAGNYSGLHWAAKTSADAVSTAADAVSTAADAVSTAADVVTTNADVVLTNADVVTTTADAAATAIDAAATAADLVLTDADTLATAADVVTTNADVVLTNADVVTTTADVVLTNADVVSADAARVLSETAQAASELALDSFDDRYLGAKGSDPTLDNDGDALLTGALYWNSGTNVMMVWNGSAWVPMAATGDAQTTNPLSQFAATTSLQLKGVLSDETGSGALVFATSPTLVTPALGTPSALVGTNISGTASSFTSSNVTTNANLTGHITSTGNATALSSFTSLELKNALSDETGSGSAVFATSPTLVTPTLGVATATSVTSSGFVGTGATEAIKLPVGTTAEQPTPATGMLRFNSDDTSFEGYNGSAWGAIGGSAANEGFTVNINAVAADYTLATNSNASSVGPMTVNTGVTVTIPTGSRWLIL